MLVEMMASQMNFSKFITIFGNYRNFFLYRPVITNCTQAATLKTESIEKLKNLPERPKRPQTSFFLFVKDHKEEVKKTNPELKLLGIVKKLSERWSKLDASIKDKYEVQYKESMKSYMQKNLEYNSKLTEEQKYVLKQIEEEKSKEKKNRKLKKTLKDLNKPKRPKGAFIYFALEYYEKEKASGIKYQEFLRKSKSIWEALSENEKEKFHGLYLNDKKRYDLEMEQWEAKMVRTGHTDLVRQSTAAVHVIPIRKIRQKDQED